MSRGRSRSPRSPRGDIEMDIDPRSPGQKSGAKVLIVTNLTRNVAESHLKTIFGHYGQITKIDVPVYPKSGQNRGKAALEFADPSDAQTAFKHMDGGQLDGSILKLPVLRHALSLLVGPGTDAIERAHSLAPLLVLGLARVPEPHLPGDAEEIPIPLVTLTEGEVGMVADEVVPPVVTRTDLVRGPALAHVRHFLDVTTTVAPLLEEDPQAIPVEDTIVAGREATLSGPVALAHVRCRAVVRAPCRTPAIPATRGARVEAGLGLGRLAEGEGLVVRAAAAVARISGIAGPGPPLLDYIPFEYLSFAVILIPKYSTSVEPIVCIRGKKK